MCVEESSETWDGTAILALDPHLKPFEAALRDRHDKYLATLRRIVEAAGSLPYSDFRFRIA